MPNQEKKSIFDALRLGITYYTSLCLGCLVGGLSFYSPSAALADRSPIQELLNSETLHDKTKRPKSSQQRWPESENYKLLLESHRRGGMLLDWLETSEVYFDDSARRVWRRASHVEALVTFPFKGKNLDLLILLPEPRSQESAALRVIEEFQNADPPSFMIQKEGTLTINGRKWRSFVTPDKRCNLTYSFRYEGIVALSQARCSDQIDILREAAAGLNIERLESKLLL
jgi:hypothetical protein